MIYISNSKNRTVATGHIGKSIIDVGNIIEFDVQFVFADGDELSHCCNILNIPVRSRSFCFVGQDARIIAANWEVKFI